MAYKIECIKKYTVIEALLYSYKYHVIYIYQEKLD